MGRKKLPEDKVKNVFLPKIRVSEEEKAEFEQKARLSGLSFSEWVRQLLKSAVD
jgi:predicted HicB family RNase H-like nuclease